MGPTATTRVDRPDAPAAHLPHLDSLRGLAAVGVLIHHAYLECEPVGPVAWWLSPLRDGHFLVTFFIILSGYCLALPTVETGRLRGGLARFAWRRARRLLPAYYAAMGLSLALIATLIGRPTGRHWDFALPVTSWSIAAHVLMVHNLDLATLYKINHAFWSIAVEWQIYFAFPALLLLTRKTGPWATAGLALAAGHLVHRQVAGTAHLGLTPSYYGMFALGMLGAAIGNGRRWAWARAEVSWWSLAGLFLVAMGCLYRTSSYERLDFPFGAACVAALVALSRPGRARTCLGCRPLVALGGCSYSLYLIHAPLIHLIVMDVFGPLGVPAAWEFPILALAGTPAILGAAWLFSIACERPFLARSSIPPGLGPASGRVAGRVEAGLDATAA